MKCVRLRLSQEYVVARKQLGTVESVVENRRTRFKAAPCWTHTTFVYVVTLYIYIYRSASHNSSQSNDKHDSCLLTI